MAEKVRYVQLAEAAGIRYLEIGFPQNPFDKESCRAARAAAKDARLVAMALLTEESIRHALDVGVDEVLLVVPSSESHLRNVYGRSLSELLSHLAQILNFCTKHRLAANVGLEDAGARDWRALDQVLAGLAQSGETFAAVSVADTRGQLTPHECVELVRFVRDRVQVHNCSVQFHAHNDLGMATANTIEVLRTPGLVDSVHATTLGFGERAGNAALEQVVVAAQLKLGVTSGIITHRLHELALHVQQAFLTAIPAHAPIFGHKVYQHESGLHQRGLIADSSSYQWLRPDAVGRRLELVLGKHSGQAFRRLIAQELGVAEERVATLQGALTTVDKQPLQREFADLLRRIRRIGFIGATREDLASFLLGSAPER